MTRSMVVPQGHMGRPRGVPAYRAAGLARRVHIHWVPGRNAISAGQGHGHRRSGQNLLTPVSLVGLGLGHQQWEPPQLGPVNHVTQGRHPQGFAKQVQMHANRAQQDHGLPRALQSAPFAQQVRTVPFHGLLCHQHAYYAQLAPGRQRQGQMSLQPVFNAMREQHRAVWVPLVR